MGTAKVLEEGICHGNSDELTPPWLPGGLCSLSLSLDGFLTQRRDRPFRVLRCSLLWGEFYPPQKRYVEVLTPQYLRI